MKWLRVPDQSDHRFRFMVINGEYLTTPQLDEAAGVGPSRIRQIADKIPGGRRDEKRYGKKKMVHPGKLLLAAELPPIDTQQHLRFAFGVTFDTAQDFTKMQENLTSSASPGLPINAGAGNDQGRCPDRRHFL